MFKNILLTTEGTRSMDRIIAYVAELFPTANLHVICVVNTSVGSIHRAKLLIDLFDKQADKALDDAKELLEAKGIKPKIVKKRGVPSKEILWYVNHHEIDLVVLGSSAQRGMAKLTFGHVGENIIRRARCPILVLNKNGRFERPGSILSPTDGKTHSVDAGILATSLANYFKATLYKCYLGLDEPLGEKVLTEASQLAKEMGVQEVGVCSIVKGDPADRILVQEENHHMIVIGKGRRSVFSFLKLDRMDHKGKLSFTSREVAALSTIPVILAGQ